VPRKRATFGGNRRGFSVNAVWLPRSYAAAKIQKERPALLWTKVAGLRRLAF
jgi:hypothetical protein